MTLADTERAFLDLCCAPEAPVPSEPLSPEHAKIWSVYRHMVRQRLLDEAKGALRRTVKVVGDDAFVAMFTRWMAEAPPRSRPFYGVVPELVAFAARHWSDDTLAPAWACDVVRYEGARYQVMDMPARRDRPVVEFDFEHPVVLHDAMLLISVDHKVHRDPSPNGSYERAPLSLCVYRGKDDRTVGAYALDAFNADCMRAWQQGENVSESVRRVAASRGADPGRHIEPLCAALSDLIERGVVLGSQP